jgi:hypothetical protein
MGHNRAIPASWIDAGSSIFNNDAGAVAPDADNDSTEGYVIGSRWYDAVADKHYICTDPTASNAVWVEVTISTRSITIPGGAANVLSAPVNLTEYSGGLTMFIETTGGASHDPVATSVQPVLCMVDGSASETTPHLTAQTAATSAGLHCFTSRPIYYTSTSLIPIDSYALQAMQFSITNGDVSATADHEVTVEITLIAWTENY